MTLIEFAQTVTERGLSGASCSSRPSGGFQARKGSIGITWHPQRGWGTYLPLNDQWIIQGESLGYLDDDGDFVPVN